MECFLFVKRRTCLTLEEDSEACTTNKDRMKLLRAGTIFYVLLSPASSHRQAGFQAASTATFCVGSKSFLVYKSWNKGGLAYLACPESDHRLSSRWNYELARTNTSRRNVRCWELLRWCAITGSWLWRKEGTCIASGQWCSYGAGVPQAARTYSCV